MARRSLRPHLNQIRVWVRQGRTDAWVAHQLEVSVQDIEQFKRQNDLSSDEEAVDGRGRDRLRGDRPARRGRRADRRRAGGRRARGRAHRRRKPRRRTRTRTSDDGGGVGRASSGRPRTRRRSRRGGRGRRSARGNAGPLEGTFDHGEEGYGLWLDPAVQDNPVYAEHWAGHRPVEVLVEEDRIVIRRTGDDG